MLVPQLIAFNDNMSTYIYKMINKSIKNIMLYILFHIQYLLTKVLDGTLCLFFGVNIHLSKGLGLDLRWTH